MEPAALLGMHFRERLLELLEGAPQRLEVGAIHLEKIAGRSEKVVHDVGFRLQTTTSEDDQLDASIVRNCAALHEAQSLEAIDNPGGVGGIALPFFGQRSHGSPSVSGQASQGTRIVGCQASAAEALGARWCCAHEELEHQLPDLSRQRLPALRRSHPSG